jgi:glycosyltransferase involved in cell wall biosynthesis
LALAYAVTRILALSPIPEEGAGCRFRVAQYRPWLERAGFTLDIHPLFDREFFRLVYQPGRYVTKANALLRRTRDRLKVIRARDEYDIVMLYREAYPIGPPWLERRLARAGVPMVYDFDDAVYLPNTSDANRIIASLKNSGKIPEVLRLCTHVVAGNSHLADVARRYNRNVTVVPTSVDTAVWVPRSTPRERGTPLVIGWIGTPTTTQYLLELGPVLQDLARTHQYVLRVSGSVTPVQFRGVTVENVPWSLEREVELFNTCDIGIYPLPDDEWTRGKCGFKAIQFMACSVPVVASPVGVNREIVEDGVSGFLAETPERWKEKLTLLITRPDMRAALGPRGRQVIEQRYSLAANAPTLVQVFQHVARRTAQA